MPDFDAAGVWRAWEVGATAVGPSSLLVAAQPMSTAFRLRPTERKLASALALFLHRQGCRTKVKRDGTILVEPLHDLHDEQAELELRLYVRLWEVLYGTRVAFLD
jgi:hypothetical protein